MFSELSIGAIKSLVTFISQIEELDILDAKTKLTLTKDGLLSLMIIKAIFHYEESTKSFCFMSGKYYSISDYLDIGFRVEWIEPFFTLATKFKKMIGSDFFIVAILLLIQVNDTENIMFDQDSLYAFIQKSYTQKLREHFKDLLIRVGTSADFYLTFFKIIVVMITFYQSQSSAKSAVVITVGRLNNHSWLQTF